MPRERENRKLGDPAKTARLKATVRELLGFLRRKAPLAADSQPPEGGEGLIASTRFPYAKTALWGSLRNFGGPHYCASGGAPSSRISGINSTLCDIQICSVEFFSLTRFYPAPPASFRTQSLVPLSIHTRTQFWARSIIENCGMYRSACRFRFIIMIILRWPFCHHMRDVAHLCVSIDVLTVSINYYPIPSGRSFNADCTRCYRREKNISSFSI